MRPGPVLSRWTLSFPCFFVVVIVVDVAVAACDPLLLWLVVCTFFSVTWSHVEPLAEPRTLYLTWIIPLQIGTAENILGFSRNVSLFSPPARLAGAAACCLFAACSPPVRRLFLSAHPSLPFGSSPLGKLLRQKREGD